MLVSYLFFIRLPIISAIDMLNIIKVDFVPNAICWAKVDHTDILFCSDKESKQVYRFDGIDCETHSNSFEPNDGIVTCLKVNYF